jgi:hypothetical protein
MPPTRAAAGRSSGIKQPTTAAAAVGQENLELVITSITPPVGPAAALGKITKPLKRRRGCLAVWSWTPGV